MGSARVTRVLVAALGVTAAAAATFAGQSPLRTTYYAYVAAESDDTVDLVRFGPSGGELVKRIPVGVFPKEIEGPHGIRVAPGGRYWFVSLAHGTPYGSVEKFQTGDDVAVGSAPAGLYPATLDISAVTGFLFVVNFNLHGDHEPSNVSVIDSVSMSEIAQIPQGVMPHGSRISPDGRFAYSVAMMSGELYEIDALKLTVSRTMKLSGAAANSMPTWVQPHPTKPLLYVALQGLDEILEIDLGTWQPRRRFHTKRGPYNVGVSPDGKTLVVTEKANDSTGFWNLETGEQRASLPASDHVPHGVAITPDSRFAFVTVEGVGAAPGLVEVYDLSTLERRAVIEVGKQAAGIDFWKME